MFIAIVIIGIIIFAFGKGGAKALLNIGLGLGLVGIVIFLIAGLSIEHSNRAERSKRAQWEWNHYTGWRIVGLGGYPSADDAAHGIWFDKKTKVDCTDKGYPGYPACAPQEYFINGKVSPAPDPWANAVPITPVQTPSVRPIETKPQPAPTPTVPVFFHYGTVTPNENYKDAFCNSDNQKVGDVFRSGTLYLINNSIHAVPTYETPEQILEAGDKLAAQKFNEICEVGVEWYALGATPAPAPIASTQKQYAPNADGLITFSPSSGAPKVRP
ncbi:MAG TPA: hypothetical protein VLA42_18260 [Verrucomicrobiae bacterium]|jgi:hypothetical protein|nr:hypothetical protein [Verrucomicrobiae bacterium]